MLTFFLAADPPPTTFDSLLPYLVGPYGGFILALIALFVLWREHKKSDAKRDDHLERQLEVNEQNAESLPLLAATVQDAIDVVGDRPLPPPRVRPPVRPRKPRTRP